jgi:preprotein translocase subunit YajC
MGAMWGIIFYTVLVAGAFYFILLQPVLKQQKDQRKAVRELQIGDEVVTSGGLIGEVMEVVTPVDGPTEIILELAPGIRVRSVTEGIQRRLSTLESEPDEESEVEAEMEEEMSRQKTPAESNVS